MPLNNTEEKLRGMGCTMDQRKRLQMAAKFGLGPLKTMGLETNKERETRSRSPVPALPGALAGLGASASSSAAVPVLRQPVAQIAARAPKRPAPRRKAGDDDDADVDAFLAGGRAMAQAAAQAQQAAKAQHIEVLAQPAPAPESSGERARREEAERLERQRREEEREQARRAEAERQEEERLRQQQDMERMDLERQREERRRIRQEEKRRRREEKARQRAQEHQGAGSEDDEDADDRSSEEEDRGRSSRRGAALKEIYKEPSKRLHWGESVKGRVSNAYKGFSDADLDRRFQQQAPQAHAGEKLMTESEVLALLRKGQKGKK